MKASRRNMRKLAFDAMRPANPPAVTKYAAKRGIGVPANTTLDEDYKQRLATHFGGE